MSNERDLREFFESIEDLQNLLKSPDFIKQDILYKVQVLLSLAEFWIYVGYRQHSISKDWVNRLRELARLNAMSIFNGGGDLQLIQWEDD